MRAFVAGRRHYELIDDEGIPANGCVRPLSEFGLIDWIRQRERVGQIEARWTKLGIGDDCAILDVGSRSNLLVTTDMLMDGRHFRLEEDGPERVGYKALGVNLSDIAAMAGVPRCASSPIALPQAGAERAGAGNLCRDGDVWPTGFGVDLIGGDTNAWNGPLVISVTLIGEATARGAVCRSGAKPGDAILVTGAAGRKPACRPAPAPRAAGRRGARPSRSGAIARPDRYLGWTLVGPLAHPRPRAAAWGPFSMKRRSRFIPMPAK